MQSILLFLLTAALLLGDTFKLYLKDGDYQVVREYQVQGDRIRYYSIDQGDWEEIPKELVDLDKTEQERKQRLDAQQKETRAQDEEDQAERELRKEIASIPMESGAYFKQDGQVKALKQAEYQVITSKSRKTLQILSPIPLVPGKASVVIKGEQSGFSFNEDRPDFYLRLAQEEQFGIIQLTPKKGSRIVEDIALIPVSHQSIEERKQIGTFQQQLGNGLYRVWPEKPLASGQYALIEYSNAEDNAQSAGDIEMLVWDFSVNLPK